MLNLNETLFWQLFLFNFRKINNSWIERLNVNFIIYFSFLFEFLFVTKYSLLI